MKTIMFVLVLSIISACTIRPDPIKVKVPGVTIESEGGNGNFCPPGQAKKGRC